MNQIQSENSSQRRNFRTQSHKFASSLERRIIDCFIVNAIEKQRVSKQTCPSPFEPVARSSIHKSTPGNVHSAQGRAEANGRSRVFRGKKSGDLGKRFGNDPDSDQSNWYLFTAFNTLNTTSIGHGVLHSARSLFRHRWSNSPMNNEALDKRVRPGQWFRKGSATVLFITVGILFAF